MLVKIVSQFYKIYLFLFGKYVFMEKPHQTKIWGKFGPELGSLSNPSLLWALLTHKRSQGRMGNGFLNAKGRIGEEGRS